MKLSRGASVKGRLQRLPIFGHFCSARLNGQADVRSKGYALRCRMYKWSCARLIPHAETRANDLARLKCYLRLKAARNSLLVGASKVSATPSKCGKTLRALGTKLRWKHLDGQVNSLGYGNNPKDWAIRSQVPQLDDLVGRMSERSAVHNSIDMDVRSLSQGCSSETGRRWVQIFALKSVLKV